MGKRNHSHLHFIWLPCSQDHVVPVLWDTAYVSITVHLGAIKQRLYPSKLLVPTLNGLCVWLHVFRWGRCNESTSGLQLAIPLQAPTVEVQRKEYGAVGVESVLTVGPSSQRMTVECVAFNLVGVSSDTFALEVSGEMIRVVVLGSTQM